MKAKLLFVIFILATQMFFAQNERDPLFNEVEIMLNSDAEKSADIICYENFNKTVEHYNIATELAQNGGESGEIRDELETAISILTKMNENLEKNLQVFNSVIEARNNALASNANKYAEYYWQLSEDEFRKSIDDLRDGNLNDVIKSLPSLEKNYVTAKNYADKTSTLLFRWQPLINAEQNFDNVLAPELYSTGTKKFHSALNYIFNGKDKKSINETIFEAGKSFDSASKTSKKFSKTYPDLIRARKGAQIAGAENYAVPVWMEADELLEETVSSFNNKNNEEADASAEAAKYKYFAAKHTAVKNRFLFETKEQIALAEREGAEKFAPKSFTDGKLNFGLVTNLIDTKSKDAEKISSLTKKASIDISNARIITKELKKIDNGDATWEDLIVEWNILEKQNNDQLSKLEIGKIPSTNENILFTAMKIFSQAELEKADEYAPKSFNKSKKLMDLAKSIQKNDNYDSSELKALADKTEKEAQKAIDITSVIKSALSNDKTGEDAILSWNVLSGIRNSADIPLWKTKNNISEIIHTKTTENTEETFHRPSSNLNDLFTFGEAEIFTTENGNKIRLLNFTFAPMGTVLNRNDKQVLNKIIGAIKLYPNSQIKIIGHTDNVGIKSVNQKISLERAKNVKKYIIQNSDIVSSRLTTEGMGETEPIAENRTYEGRKKNRRIEVEISN